MKIRDAHITFAKGDKPIKASMILERDDGVFTVLDNLRDNVRDYDSMYEHLLECGDK